MGNTLGIHSQTRLTDRIAINLYGGYDLVNNLNEINLTSGATSIYVPSNTLFFGTILNYQFIPNRLVGGITYEYDSFSTSKSLSNVDPSLSGEAKQNNANVFGLRMQYLFN